MSAGAAQAGKSAETLVLFSDGTGNSSAKLFKTNVWRMYEAVDLGPDAANGPLQVAYYDNGVGTQAYRFLAILAGIFGFGLKTNVLRLYRFACRNGTEGCHIYCFGFSRGAYTIRLVAALIADQGLVQYDNEGELNARSIDAFRRFMKANNPNVLGGFVGVPARAARDGLVWLKRHIIGPRIDPKSRRAVEATIAFIGVWDTVAAYGGPIAELTRGIDDYLYPLTMTDYRLDGRVRCARHALAIDDERDAFHPLLWDELAWKMKADEAHDPVAEPEANQAFRERLKQVWFAGMHSDVGGGYPDENLSYVSLTWMMAEASQAGLRLLPAAQRRVRDLGNSLGPMHDSRGGFGAYYRPQPRKIAAFVHQEKGELRTSTLSMRDPVVGELQDPPHGQLLECRVHESVIARLESGTDDYAPATLPPKIVVEPYSADVRRKGGHRSADPDLVDHLQQEDIGWWRRQEELWNWLWLRRVVYFLTVLVTVAWITLPAWVDLFPEPDRTDGRWLMERLTGWSRFVVPDLIRPWVRAFEINPWLFWGLLSGAAIGSWLGGLLRRIAWSKSRDLWDRRLSRTQFDQGPLKGFAKWRTSKAYQGTFQALKWRVAPLLAAILMALAGIWIAVIAGTQIAWSAAEDNLCRRAGQSDPAPAAIGAGKSFVFTTYDTCVAPRLWVERGRRYEITFDVGEKWSDDDESTTPRGLGALQLNGWGVIFAPMRRIVDANYLQPLYEVRPDDSDQRVSRVLLGALRLVRDERNKGRYTAVIAPTESGELFLFGNDAAVLGWRNRFYNNNCGTALVTVRDMDGPDVVRAATPDHLSPPIPEWCIPAP